MARVSILAVGTELTSGQITNRNAAWISEDLVSLGFQVRLHEAVPDDRSVIRESLTHCAKDTELLIVTGGLGPTSDDFTREVIADWAGLPLVYREESWKKIVVRLTERGIPVAESNQRQCHFPEGSVVLENLEGTADAFRFKHAGTDIVVLPGPPREGHHVWERLVRPWLKENWSGLIPERLLLWKTLGKSESALAELVEEVVKGTGLQTGYRASVPYVEVKVWVPHGLDSRIAEKAITRLDSEIGIYTVARGSEDLAEIFFSKLTEKTGTLGVTILDLGTEGALTSRLIEALRSPLGRSIQDRLEIMTRTHDRSDANHLPEMATEWIFGLFWSGQAVVLGPRGRWMKEIVAPFKGELMRDRLRKYQTERALQFFIETLSLT